MLSEKLARLSNATMRVKEWDGDVIFLHEVGPGAADRSYGIRVARLAGLPASVVARARDVLTRLEDADRKNPASQLIDDLPLFQVAVRREETSRRPSKVEEALKAMSLDDMPLLVRFVIAPGFADDPEKFDITIRMVESGAAAGRNFSHKVNLSRKRID